MPSLVFGAFTDAGGEVNNLNEDAYLANSKRLLFGVADGYGGANIGDQAAKKTLERVEYFVDHGLGDSEVTLPFVYRGYYTAGGNLVFNAFLYANQILYKENQKQNINGRGGASTLFTFFEGNHMTLASVGGCQAVLLRNSTVRPLLYPRVYNALKLGPGSEKWEPEWSSPLAGMGHSKDLEPEVIELQVAKGDIILLMTDGIFPFLKQEDFSQYFSRVSAAAKSGAPLDPLLLEENQRLKGVATQGGGIDNKCLISLVCL